MMTTCTLGARFGRMSVDDEKGEDQISKVLDAITEIYSATANSATSSEIQPR